MPWVVTGRQPRQNRQYNSQQIQYPSGRTVNYVPDSAGRISAVQNGTTLANYAALTYAPDKLTMALGNGITEQLSWNSRFQVTGLTAGTALTLGFNPCPGQAVTCTTGNNGNLRSETITAPGFSVTQTYTYDNVDRLTGSSEAGTGSWKEGYQLRRGKGEVCKSEHVGHFYFAGKGDTSTLRRHSIRAFDIIIRQ